MTPNQNISVAHVIYIKNAHFVYICTNIFYTTYIIWLAIPKNTGHLEWNALGDFPEFKTNGDSKEAL